MHACRSGECSDQETSNFSCGSCPSSPSSQTPINGETLACTATGVDLSWTGPAGSLYNLRVDGEGARTANNISNNCSPHTICINGYTEEKIKINIQSGKSYTWWVDIQAPSTCGYLTTGTKTFTTASCSPPSIQSLYIRDAQTNTQKDGQRISGRSVDQGGSGFNNPLVITLNATAGQAKTTSYFVAFYNQSDGILSDLSKFPSFKTPDSSTLQTRLNDLRNGVLLRYDEDTGGTNKKYYVWARNKWKNLANYAKSGLPLCNAQDIPGDCNDTNRLYTVFPTSNPRQWGLRFDKNFGDKTMFTTAVVSDSNNLSAFRGGDMTPE